MYVQQLSRQFSGGVRISCKAKIAQSALVIVVHVLALVSIKPFDGYRGLRECSCQAYHPTRSFVATMIKVFVVDMPQYKHCR